MSANKKWIRGFTLIEVLIVVVIVGILAGLAIPRYMKASVKAKQTEAKLVLKQIFVMQQAYRQEFDCYWIPPEGTWASHENPDVFAQIGIEVLPQARYKYTIKRSEAGFKAEAVAENLDDDPDEDRWEINEAGTLIALSDDALR